MTEETEVEVDDSSHSYTPYVILFIFVSCALGALIRTIVKKINLPIPYTVLLLIVGLLFGILTSRYAEVAVYSSMANMDPHLIMHVFLPVLIFESAFAMDVHTFKKSFIQVIILSVFGLIVATLLTAVLAVNLFAYNWSWEIGIMFGAVLSATDPVAVVSVLKELGASKQLGTVIEGESLLNDGCAIVIFEIFMDLILLKPGASLEWTHILVYLVRVSLGGPAFGFVMGKITTLWLLRIFNDALTEITITLAMTYLTYYIGDAVLGVSGVLAVVVLGLVVNSGRTAISPEVEVFLHRFWEMLAYLANTLIFITVGVVITERAVPHAQGIDWFYILALYMGIILIRAFSVGLFSPILSRIGYGLNWKNGIIVVWGGLRGAVGLALALSVAQTAGIDQENVGNKIMLHCAGIVLLTLIINATTISYVLEKLGMSDISIPKRMAMLSAVRHLQEGQIRVFQMLKNDRFLADAQWSIAEELCIIEDPYKTQELEESSENYVPIARYSTCPCCSERVMNEPSAKEFSDMAEEARLRLLQAEKVSYWKQFEHGMLESEAVQVLVGANDTAGDSSGAFIDINEIKKHFQIRGVYPFLKRKLEESVSEKQDSLSPPKNKILLTAFKIANTLLFHTIFNLVILINIIALAVELTLQQRDEAQYEQYLTVFTVMNYVFCILYIIEAVLKAMAQRKAYIFSHWNQFDLLIIVLSITDIVVNLSVPKSISINPAFFKIAKVFRLLRLSRVLRLSKPLIPKIIDFFNNRINDQLSLGYDVGKGFVLAEEEILKLIPKMVDNATIASNITKKSTRNRLEVVKELGLLQKAHPGIAVSVKTRQAIRAVLNHARDMIRELQEEGLLDESEALKLETLVEIKMKRQQNFPSFIPPPPPDHMLRNVPWLEGDENLISFITDRAIMCYYDYGQIIITQGEPCDGIYLILSGMVRIFGQGFTSSECESADVPKISPSSGSTGGMFEDYMTAGNIIGEMGFLTDKPRNSNVECATSVQAYYLSSDDMRVACGIFSDEPSLEYRLWRVCAMRVATPLLLDQLQYQGWTEEKVRLHLEKSYMPYLENKTKFDTDDQMDDVVLIQGTVTNAHTRALIIGPSYISRMVHKLLLTSNDVKLLIVPNTDHVTAQSEPEMSRQSLILPQESSLCLRHASQNKIGVFSKSSMMSLHRPSLLALNVSSHKLAKNSKGKNVKKPTKNTIDVERPMMSPSPVPLPPDEFRRPIPEIMFEMNDETEKTTKPIQQSGLPPIEKTSDHKSNI